MTLSQSVVSELLDAFRAGEGVDLIRDAVRLVLQERVCFPSPCTVSGTLRNAAPTNEGITAAYA